MEVTNVQAIIFHCLLIHLEKFGIYVSTSNLDRNIWEITDNGVSHFTVISHRQHYCCLNSLFQLTTRKTSKFNITGPLSEKLIGGWMVYYQTIAVSCILQNRLKTPPSKNVFFVVIFQKDWIFYKCMMECNGMLNYSSTNKSLFNLFNIKTDSMHSMRVTVEGLVMTCRWLPTWLTARRCYLIRSRFHQFISCHMTSSAQHNHNRRTICLKSSTWSPPMI